MAPSSALTLCSHAHLAYRLRAEFDQRQQAEGHETWEAAPVLTLSRWLEQLWISIGNDRLLLTTPQEHLLWQSIITADPGADLLLDIPATAARAATSWRLAQEWQLDWRAADGKASDETTAFSAWSESLRRACTANAWLTAAELPAAITARLSAAAPAIPARINLAGFEPNALTPQLGALLQAITAAGVDVFFNELAPAPATPERDSASDASGELERAALWARKRLEANAPGLIGVIIPDLAQRRAEVARVFSRVFHPDLAPWDPSPRAFHIATAPALAEAPIVASALSMLATWLDPEPLELAAILALLRSPFLASAETEAVARAQLEQKLRRRNATRWRWRDITAHAAGAGCPVWADLTANAQRLTRRWPQTQTHSEWLESFAALWQSLGWPGERPLASDDWQIQHAWERLLDEFGRLDQVAPTPIPATAAAACLRRLALQQSFQPQSAPAPVEILGLREAEGLEFTHLRVCGLHDEAVPAAPQPDPFLPIAWQRDCKLPQASAETQAIAAARWWQRLLHQSPILVASFPRQRADEQPLRPSPLLATYTITHTESYSPPLPRTATVQPLVDSVAPPASKDQCIGGSSLIKDQSACPFRSFAHRRLHAKQSDPLIQGLPATARGNLLHNVLARVRLLLDPQSPVPSLDALRALIAPLAAEVVRHAPALNDQPAIAAIECERLITLACTWYDQIERHRLPFAASTIEAKSAAQIGPLTLNLVRDRVDDLLDGSLALFDYKSGAVKLAAWNGDYPEEPQLPLYVVTEPDPTRVAAVAFAQVLAGDMKLVGLERAPGLLSDSRLQRIKDNLLSDQQIADWRTRLTALADEYHQGYAAVQPRHCNSCDYCDLSLLCRIDESGRGARDAEEGDHGDAA